jgi:urease accessory protein
MSASVPRARTLHPGGLPGTAHAVLRLDYAARLVRRKRVTVEGGQAVLIDLAEVTDLRDGDWLQTDDGLTIKVEAAQEPLMEVRGDLVRLAWHIGNRHAPCQIMPDRLLLQRETVMRRMLEGLGAEVIDVTATFRPEGGAYGHGRVMGHDHGPALGHVHGHAHGHGHSHGHEPDPDLSHQQGD